MHGESRRLVIGTQIYSFGVLSGVNEVVCSIISGIRCYATDSVFPFIRQIQTIMQTWLSFMDSKQNLDLLEDVSRIYIGRYK